MIKDNYQEYERIALEIADLLDHKNQMYGSSFDKTVDEYGLSVICLRLEDKLNRLKSIVLENKKDFGDEKLEDTLNIDADFWMKLHELYNDELKAFEESQLV